MLQLADLAKFTYSIDEINQWFGNTDCAIEVKKSSDGKYLEVWDSSDWIDFEGPDEEFRPTLTQRLTICDAASEEGWCRELVYGRSFMVVRHLLEGWAKGQIFDATKLLAEEWYILCSFLKPEAAWNLVYPDNPLNPGFASTFDDAKDLER